MRPHNLAARRRNAEALAVADDLGAIARLLHAAELEVELARKRLLDTPVGLLPAGLVNGIWYDTDRACAVAIERLRQVQRNVAIVKGEAA